FREKRPGNSGRGFGPGHAGPPAGEEEGDVAETAARVRADEPVDRRLLRLPPLSAGDERLSVADALRPAQPAALDRARELPLRVRQRPEPLAGDQEHALDHRLRRTAAG